MKKQAQEKYVTEVVFNKEINGLHQKVDSSVDRLGQKIDRIALELIKTQEDLREVKETMSTKEDVNLILNRIDGLSKQMSVFDQEERVQSFQLQDVRAKVENHEARLTVLESSPK